ncbi:hypothetical protein FGO68_gene900 [Halteria grandinella]|uniref:RING-type domain-containing protein n=1 Tax=Halteria grandinella TaxID=5974 RepID=A0A8J8NS06_HALGN|nr:hypothetical protein FGO68_gene900 [Halteria grandinella]
MQAYLGQQPFSKRFLQENEGEATKTDSNQSAPSSTGQQVVFYILFVGLIAGALCMIIYLIRKCICPNAKSLFSKRPVGDVTKIHPPSQQIQEPTPSQQQISTCQTQLSTVIPFMADDDETAHSSFLSVNSQQMHSPARPRQMLQEVQQTSQPAQTVLPGNHRIEKNIIDRNEDETQRKKQRAKRRNRREERKNDISSQFDSFDGSSKNSHFPGQNGDRIAMELEIKHMQFCRKFPRKRYTEVKEMLFKLRDKSFLPKECQICWKSINNRDFCRVLPCMHVLHQPCIDSFFQDLKACPICHVDLTDDNCFIDQYDLMQSIHVDNEHFFSEHLARNAAWHDAVIVDDMCPIEQLKFLRKTTGLCNIGNHADELEPRWGSQTIYQDYKQLKIIKIAADEGPPKMGRSQSESPKNFRSQNTRFSTLESSFEFADVNESYNNQKEQWMKVLKHTIKMV